jgi:hypothetical protein
MQEHIYANLEMRNTGTTAQAINLIEVREPRVLSQPDKYLITVDRFSIHRCFLPMYEDVVDLKVRFIKQADMTYGESTLSFAGVKDSNNLVWNAQDFVSAFNSSVNNAMGALGGVVGTAPSMTLNNATMIATITTSGITNFNTTYVLGFNEPLYAILSTFLYLTLSPNTQWFYPVLSNTTTSSLEGINLSPVDKIIIKTNRIPVVSEMIQFNSNNSGQASRQTDAVLTDFSFSGANKFPMNDMEYNATGGQYRFHSMQDTGTFTTIDLAFYYKTYNNNVFPLNIIPSGSCNVKILFKQIEE